MTTTTTASTTTGTRRSARALAGAAALLLAASTTSCTELSGSNTKVGGDPDPITLTMGTDDTQGRPAALQIEKFAREVEERSGGSLLVEPRLAAAGPDQPAWDQKVARLVTDGDLDLGMIPSRAWDTEGVHTLRALNTPFLVTTDAAMNAVATDDALATDLMAGLDDVGVTGLALVPEGLRHLFLYDEPQLAEDTLRGAVVRSPRSETTWAFLEALGAEPSDSVADDEFSVAETSFAVAPPGAVRTAAGNLTLFPKVNVVAANSARFAGLTEEQQEALRGAALATRDWAIETNVSDRAQAADWCAQGMGDVINAGDAMVAAAHAAARPVIADLRGDEQTAALITRVEALTDPAAASAVEPCRRDQAATSTAPVLSPTGGDLPDGTYRAEYTDSYLRSRVRTPDGVANNHGVWTFALKDGHWSFDQAAPDITDHEEGVYEVRGDHLFWALSEGQVLHFRWRTDADGDLHFEQFRDFGADVDPDYPFPDFQFDQEWVRVR